MMRSRTIRTTNANGIITDCQSPDPALGLFLSMCFARGNKNTSMAISAKAQAIFIQSDISIFFPEK